MTFPPHGNISACRNSAGPHRTPRSSGKIDPPGGAGAAVIGDDPATAWCDSGDGADHHLMRYHQHQLARLNPLHPCAQHGQRFTPVNMSVKEGIQPGKGLRRPDIHFGCSIAAAAPLTGQNDIWRYAAGAEICPDIAGLRAAAFIKVALCRAIINPEM